MCIVREKEIVFHTIAEYNWILTRQQIAWGAKKSWISTVISKVSRSDVISKKTQNSKNKREKKENILCWKNDRHKNRLEFIIKIVHFIIWPFCNFIIITKELPKTLHRQHFANHNDFCRRGLKMCAPYPMWCDKLCIHKRIPLRLHIRACWDMLEHLCMQVHFHGSSIPIDLIYLFSKWHNSLYHLNSWHNFISSATIQFDFVSAESGPSSANTRTDSEQYAYNLIKYRSLPLFEYHFVYKTFKKTYLLRIIFRIFSVRSCDKNTYRRF